MENLQDTSIRINNIYIQEFHPLIWKQIKIKLFINFIITYIIIKLIIVRILIILVINYI